MTMTRPILRAYMWKAIKSAHGLTRAEMLARMRGASLASMYEEIRPPASAPPEIAIKEPPRPRPRIMDAVRIKPRPYAGKPNPN